MKQYKLIILLTLLMSMVGAKTFAHDIEVANADGVTIYYNWTNNNTELSVSYQGYSENSYPNEYTGNVVIPQNVTYNGNVYPVASIGDYAFCGCSSLTSVTIPNNVISIGKYAFDGCRGLVSVNISNNVKVIYSCAFRECINLTSVTIPNSVTIIFNHAFTGCQNLNSITLGNNVKYILEYAFCNCSALTSVTIPNSVTSIGQYAFYQCI